MNWGIAGRNAVRMIRSLAAVPFRLAGWLCVLVVLPVLAVMRACSWVAHVVEGV